MPASITSTDSESEITPRGKPLSIHTIEIRSNTTKPLSTVDCDLS